MYFTTCAFFVAFVSSVLATQPDDQIILPDFNETFYIADEVYNFTLIPAYQVPLQLYRHIIYTATSSVVANIVKRTLIQNKNSLHDLAPEDHQVLSEYVDLPDFVKVDVKKRSLDSDENGVRMIPLSKKAHIFYFTQNSEKRAVQQGVPLGTSLCLSVPFFTTCDDSQDLSAVKASLQASANDFYTEIDSYENTNNLRANEMAATLDKQRAQLVSLAQETSVTLGFINTLASTTAINSAQIAHGDYIIAAQVDYLTRITNSLLRFTNALTSTDPRTVTAQPSLSKLFTGFLLELSYLPTMDPPGIPITDSRLFNWTEIRLPTDSVTNIVSYSEPYVSMAVQVNISMGFMATTTMACASISTSSPQRCVTPVSGTYTMANVIGVISGDQWIFGPFHQDHVGIYPLDDPTGVVSGQTTFTNVINTSIPGVPSAGGPSSLPTYISYFPLINGTIPATTLYCVDFLGYKMLSTFYTTPYMLNGLTPGVSPNPMSQCDDYLFRNRPSVTYFLFAVASGVVVPFYSNCKADEFMADANTTIPVGYLANYPNTNSTPNLANFHPATISTQFEMNARHYTGPNCAMNLEPEWIGLSYYFPPNNITTISNIPRGYNLNEFTINPAGELSSSLEFLYTNTWAWVYTVQRVSKNNIIVDEVTALEGSTVLFNLEGNTIVDESDSFYGEGNNGRDCIHYASTYEYDITTCYFQNDQTGYFADQYLAGSVTTTGIARYVDKFTFQFYAVDGNYQFSLVPKQNADFSFSVSPSGGVCPQLILATSSISGCVYQFSYSGNEQILFNSQLVTFSANQTSAPITVPYNDPTQLVSTVYASGKQCMVLKCVFGGNAQTSTVQVQTPNTQIISADDLALHSTVTDIIGTLNSTIQSMLNVQGEVAQSQAQLDIIINALNSLNFNVTKLVPYQDFSDLRAQVESMINDLQPTGSMDCSSGVFGSAGCFGRNILNIILIVVVIVVIILLAYVVCVKMGIAKKLCGK